MMLYFKKWLLEESTVAQELKKIKPTEELKKKSNEIFENTFNFLNDKNKEKEIKDWILLQITTNIQFWDIEDFSRLVHQARDFLAAKYETINFKNALYKLRDLVEDNRKWHEELAKSGHVGKKGAWGKIIIKFPNGWSWVSLEKGFCPIEAATMGHCGNVVGQTNKNHNILSLRDEKNVPQLTFIDNGEGVLGEMKGRMNKKPDRSYHKYIIELLLHPTIKKIVGGGYLSQNNFQLNDLTPEEKHEVLSIKPDLLPGVKDYYNYLTEEDQEVFIEALIRSNLIDNKGNLIIDDYDYDYDYDEKTGKVIKNRYTHPEIIDDKHREFIIQKYNEIINKSNGNNIVIRLFLRHKKTISEYLFEKFKPLSNDQTCHEIMSILYDENKKKFFEIFNKEDSNFRSDLIRNFTDINKKFDDELLKHLDYNTLVTIDYYDLNKTKKIKNPKLKEIIEKEIRFPRILEKERNMGAKNTKIGSIEDVEFTENIEKTLLKIVNDQQLTDEENKIFDYSIPFLKNTIKEIYNLLKSSLQIEEEKYLINTLKEFLYRKSFGLGDHYYILFIEKFINKIKELGEETKKIVVDNLDRYIYDNEPDTDGYARLNYSRFGQYSIIQLRELRQKIRDVWQQKNKKK
jgi:hypothetical protein